jgi:DNA-binding transcriptional LysR family regulator
MRPTNFRTLDLNLLKVFDVVMVERHVTRAAEKLAMTQPAVSNALRRLRDATNQDLFVATSAGVVPTAHAVALWPVVRQSLHHLQQALTPQEFDASVDQRRFILAMADATATLFVPVLTQALIQEHAQVDLQMVGLQSRDPRAELERGQADAAVGFFPDVRAALAAEGESALTVLEPLYACRYVCVMRKGHPLAQAGALTLQAYCEALHLRVSFAGRPRGFVDEALVRLGRARRVMITVNQFSTAGAVVRQTDLLTVLPRSFVAAAGIAQDLAIQPLPFEMPAIEVGLLWHRRDEQDDAQRWLRATLARAAQQISAQMS